MRVDRVGKPFNPPAVSHRSASINVKPPEAAAVTHLQSEVARLRQAIVSLESVVRAQPTLPSTPARPWWMALQEEIDAP
ncbi:hypothetical protein KJ567_06410, partial [Candidatus Bipolaricaulota bacterium]|nr:hypothetical protein [Candidatus Bipolaricaulota bacterium]